MMHFLKFPDQQTYQSLLTPTEQDGQSVFTTPQGLTVDAIGTIWQGGQWDAEGNQLVAPVALVGYHVNALGELPPAWQPYEIAQPANPVRLFAGWPA